MTSYGLSGVGARSGGRVSPWIIINLCLYCDMQFGNLDAYSQWDFRVVLSTFRNHWARWHSCSPAKMLVPLGKSRFPHPRSRIRTEPSNVCTETSRCHTEYFTTKFVDACRNQAGIIASAPQPPNSSPTSPVSCPLLPNPHHPLPGRLLPLPPQAQRHPPRQHSSSSG